MNYILSWRRTRLCGSLYLMELPSLRWCSQVSAPTPSAPVFVKQALSMQMVLIWVLRSWLRISFKILHLCFLGCFRSLPCLHSPRRAPCSAWVSPFLGVLPSGFQGDGLIIRCFPEALEQCEHTGFPPATPGATEFVE